ncbi:DUF4296 domain-containing protein [Hanstruepera neustonica]|uniref:DUF4296 domain-containing protein n=1 Tax=Hanstruepera neustonica TaxID=1445657 RepID=A0A2K1E4C5_9FLAO|nr:DUF4296 domain-containing protein [Hanstruepera neustonica]PNQ75081.1 DUF4296 domain-containing protein [Hanstruepera neustonica]
MKKALIFSTGILMVIFSCKDNMEPTKPENLISQDEMVNILIDLSLVSSAKGLNKKILENNGITPDRYVFEKHKIDSIQFAESNAYYAYFIDDYSNIYVRVKDSLEKLKMKYVRLEQAENKKGNDAKADKAKRVKRDTLRKKQNDSLLQPPTFEEN